MLTLIHEVEYNVHIEEINFGIYLNSYNSLVVFSSKLVGRSIGNIDRKEVREWKN
ncbi:hypothetical protein SDC9_56745 [bioreactor metagenome]|uniref:Uncharacterized protein n=1 Tax=bioreactor metagenome TaxID=1076179 RepID=A0A644X808_9ZZZZ